MHSSGVGFWPVLRFQVRSLCICVAAGLQPASLQLSWTGCKPVLLSRHGNGLRPQSSAGSGHQGRPELERYVVVAQAYSLCILDNQRSGFGVLKLTTGREGTKMRQNGFWKILVKAQYRAKRGRGLAQEAEGEGDSSVREFCGDLNRNASNML